jgi:hypothetical protein
MIGKRSVLLHPFVFAVYFVFYFWSKNLNVSFSEVWPPALFFLIFSIIAVFILGLIIRSFKKAGLIITLFFILFFSYGHARTLLGNAKLFGIEIGRHSYLMVIWLAIFVLFSLAIILLLRKEKIINALTNYLNLTGLLLVIFVFSPIINFQIKNVIFKQKKVISKKIETPDPASAENYTQSVDKNLPDIYYIILDSYMNQDVLKSELGFDDSEFCDWLRGKGFFVSSSSRSNYTWTSLSVPSSLNFRYLNAEDKDKESALLYNNEVVKILRSKGYKIISIYFTSEGRHHYGVDADMKFAYGPAKEFLPSLIDSSWAYPVTFFGFFNSLIYNYQRAGVRFSLEKLREMPEIKEPTFTFAHIMSPHPPYIFNKDGKPLRFGLTELRCLLNNKKGDLWHNQECRAYTEQTLFVNKRIKSVLEHILFSSPGSIIIIQGDHGQFLGLADKPSKKLFRLRTSILNAYYLPGEKKNLLYNGISPVNSFRVVFNEYFNKDYKLLPDVSYFSSSDNLWDFIMLKKEDLTGD